MKKRTESVKSIYTLCANGFMLAISTAIFIWRWYAYIRFDMDRAFQGKGNILMFALYVVLVVVSLRMCKGFSLGKERLTRLVAAQILAFLLLAALLFSVLSLIVGHIGKLTEIGLEVLIVTVLSILEYLIFDIIFVNIYIRVFPPYRMVQVYGEYDNDLVSKMESRLDKYNIVSEISANAPWEEMEKLFYSHDAILLNDVPLELERQIIKFGYAHSKRVYFTPKISDILVKGSEEINFFDSPLFLNKNRGISAGQRIVKRAFDIIASFIALIILSPIFLIISILIKAEDGGPVFYRQERVTFRHRHFMILKFRSMIVDAEKDGLSIPAGEKDPRITKIGSFIRATRIDELPQLINIIKGDMSVVGPRPERVEHMEKYTQILPEFDYRLKVKGGLTGYAQVYGKYNTTAYDKLKMDLLYITNYSFALDIQIMFETLKILFRKESTEGFTDKQAKAIREMEMHAHDD